MALSEIDISLNIQNNRNYPQQISVMANPSNLLDTANATREFRWNVTGFTFTTENSVLVQYKINGASVFSSFDGQLPVQSIQGVVDILNGLGIGFFNSYTELGQDYIGTYNQNYTFGALNIYEATLLNPAFISGTGFNGTVNFINSNYVGGAFNNYNGTAIGYGITLLNNDGSINNSLTTGTGTDNQINSIAIQTDGKILLGGAFTTYNGTGANAIIRLNSDGSVDASFVYGTGFNSTVTSILVQTDGKILVGGNFTSYNGTGANRIIRLNSNGSVDASFVYGTAFNQSVNTIAIQTDGKILCGGFFTSYNGTGANRIIRLNSDGSVDASFVYGTAFDNAVWAFAIQPNGQILVGGDFQFYNGVGYYFIIRLNSDGTADNTWAINQGFDTGVYTILLQSNGQIICGGGFQFYNTIPCNSIARLNNNSTFDTTWNIGSGFDAPVSSISYLSGTTSSILVGGQFTTFNGQTANRIANLLL